MKHYAKGLSIALTATSGLVLAGCGAAADAGIFISTDGGSAYTQSSVLDVEKSFADRSVSALATNPAATQTVYAGLEDGGVVISDDGGMSWRSTVLREGSPRGIAINPGGTEVYLAYGSQVIVSRDG